MLRRALEGSEAFRVKPNAQIVWFSFVGCDLLFSRVQIEL